MTQSAPSPSNVDAYVWNASELVKDVSPLSSSEAFLARYFQTVDPVFTTSTSKFPLKLVFIDRSGPMCCNAACAPFNHQAAPDVPFNTMNLYGDVRAALLLGTVLLEWCEPGIVLPRYIGGLLRSNKGLFDTNTIRNISGNGIELEKIAEVCVRYNTTNAYSYAKCNAHHFAKAVLKAILVDSMEKNACKCVWEYVNMCADDAVANQMCMEHRHSEDKEGERSSDDETRPSRTFFSTRKDIKEFVHTHEHALSEAQRELLKSFDHAMWFTQLTAQTTSAITPHVTEES